MHTDSHAPAVRRLFFAVEVCPEVRDAITELVDRIKKAAHFTPVDVTWPTPNNYHITLFFLGNVSSEKAETLRKLVQNDKPPIEPFALDFRHISTFPQEKQKIPKVLWAGVHNPPDAMTQLRNYTASLITRAKLPVPDQDFTPHLTLARFKGTKGLFAFRKILETYKFQKFGTSEVDRLVLMESITGKGPATYKPFAAAELKHA